MNEERICRIVSEGWNAHENAIRRADHHRDRDDVIGDPFQFSGHLRNMQIRGYCAGTCAVICGGGGGS